MIKAEITDATAQDAAQIAKIWNDVIQHTTATFTTLLKSEDEIAKRIAVSPVFVCKTEAQNVIGFATYGSFRDGPGYAEVAEYTNYVRPDKVGQGYGARLLQRVVSHAAQAGISSLIAGVAGENQSAMQFHLAMGFEKVAHLSKVGRKFGRYHDLVLMQKNLRDLD